VPETKQNKKQISKKKYREILSGLELRNLRIVDGKFSLKREELSPESDLKIWEKASYEIEPEGSVIIIHTYKISLINKENRRKSLGIECTFCLDYISEKGFSGEFFEIFKKHNLPINTWPFFREYVFNITSRMSIPPLTLPLLKRYAK